MIRNVKLLVLGTLALLAIGAGTAMAVPNFEKPPEPITATVTSDGTGTTKHYVWNLAAAALTCAESTGSFTSGGTASQVSQLISAAWNYISCITLGQLFEAKMNGCNYILYAEGVTDISCPEGKAIEFSGASPPCLIKIGSQSKLGKVSYKNIKSGEIGEVTVSPEITGIKYTASGAGCLEVGSKTNGSLSTGNFILTGEKDDGSKVMVNLSHNP